MVVFFMDMFAHIYSKCLIKRNVPEGRDHVELTFVALLPRISEILNKYLLNKSINRIYISNNKIYFTCYVTLIYNWLRQISCYICNTVLGKKIAFGQPLRILPKMVILKLSYKQGYTVLYTRMSNSVLTFIFPREYI